MASVQHKYRDRHASHAERLIDVAMAFLKADGWKVRSHGNRFEAVRGNCCKAIVAREPHLWTRLEVPTGVAVSGIGKQPTIQVAYSRHHYSSFVPIRNDLAQHRVPVLWVEDDAVVETWNYPPQESEDS